MNAKRSMQSEATRALAAYATRLTPAIACASATYERPTSSTHSAGVVVVTLF